MKPAKNSVDDSARHGKKQEKEEKTAVTELNIFISNFFFRNNKLEVTMVDLICETIVETENYLVWTITQKQTTVMIQCSG